MKQQTQTKIRRKEISFDDDKPKLKLEEIAVGRILVKGTDKELIYTSPVQFERESSWRYFRTLSRRGDNKIVEKIYSGYIDEGYLHGIRVHDTFDYKKYDAEQSEVNIFEAYDLKLNEAGIKE
jgi:hypothetical protein